MPDISRSDSNRSDASRPRVSFNRDVHVKRISGPRTANAYSLSSDGTSFVPTSVRRERPMSRKEMTKEAEVVLKQVDKVSCTATSNLKLDAGEKPKKRKKRKDSFSFLKKPDKTKTSSSDYDSGSSQEYRIYQVNGPANNSLNSRGSEPGKARKPEKKLYDFMSLDRKKLRKDKNRTLEYLSLERHDVLDKMRKDRPKTLLAAVFDRIDRGRKSASPPPEPPKPKPKLSLDLPDDHPNKKQLSPIIESPRPDYFHTQQKPPPLSPPPNTPPTTPHHHRPLPPTRPDALRLKQPLASTAPTDDVIYAQVIVGGREGSAQKATVNERVAGTEVGRVFVGEESNQSQVGLNYKSGWSRNGGVCERVSAEGDGMWQGRGECVGRRERGEGGGLGQRGVCGERGRWGARDESGGASGSGSGEELGRVVRVGGRQEGGRRAPADLQDLSLRREMLLSRSESQAKERFNSLRRLQEAGRVRREVSSVNGVRPGERAAREEGRCVEEEVDVRQKVGGGLRKGSKEGEAPEALARKKRESKLEGYLKEKEERPRQHEKGHVIVTDDDDSLLRRLTRLGKSKSFLQDRPKNNRMDRVKMLFSKRKDGRASDSDDDLANRYIEYRGSDVETTDRSADSSPRRPLHRAATAPLEGSYGGRKRMSTPTPYDGLGTLTRMKNDRNKESHWLKPLEKMGKKGKAKSKADDPTTEGTNSPKQTSLRFFGDTDQESTTNDADLAEAKAKYGLQRAGRLSDSDDDTLNTPSRPESRMTDSTLKGSSTGRQKSKYDLDRPDYGLKQMNHSLQMAANRGDTLSDSPTVQIDSYDINGLKYGPSVTRSSSSATSTPRYGQKEKLRNLKSTPTTSVSTPEEPLSRRVKSHGNLYSQDDGKRGGRRRLYESSADSATEGDSSQHSSKSMIYLHAATVGDIPGPRNIYKSERRSQSREELSSIGDSTVLAPGKKTLSRSFSVLAPWRPKHNKDDRTLHYDSVDYGRGKPPTGMAKSKRSSSRDGKPTELRFNRIGKEGRKRKDLLR